MQGGRKGRVVRYKEGRDPGKVVREKVCRCLASRETTAKINSRYGIMNHIIKLALHPLAGLEVG